MKLAGIIVEYNPFHNGHLYHIQKTKELTNCDAIVAITSGNFSQRGDVSVIDKFEKTKAALLNGVDLVIELPYVFTTQNAYVFGQRSVELLKQFNVDDIVFGSETNNLEELKKYAELNIDVTRLKELMNKGESYPKAYGLLAGALYPNDILAVTYLKALQGTNINPISIQRTNDYHGEELETISSASAIRKTLKTNSDYHIATPIDINNPHFLEEFYPYLRRLLFTLSKEDLQNIHLISEGIENLLVKNAMEFNDFEDFMNASISRRYTKARIQRILLQIIMQIKKEDISSLAEPNYIRVLGFNEKGREILKAYQGEYKLVTQFKNIPQNYKEIEWKASLMYASLLDNPEEYIKKELKGPIIIE